MLEKIFENDELIGLIVRNRFSADGITFFTNDDSAQQLAYMRHPIGKEILPHVHNSVKREIFFTTEVLFLKKGVMRVDFYTSSQMYIESKLLYAGDVVMLSGGGHGFKVIEEVEMIEVKQGPYLGEMDKIRFSSVDFSKIKLN